MRQLVLVAVMAILGGCVPLEERPAAPAPGTPSSTGRISTATPQPYGLNPKTGAYPKNAADVSGPTVVSLLDQAKSELDAGRSDQSVATIERALRIEPKNPFLWQALADAHLKQNLPDQAETVAQRSNSFANGNPYVEVENWRVIASARQARGDTAGAQQAQAKMVELQEKLNHQ